MWLEVAILYCLSPPKSIGWRPFGWQGKNTSKGDREVFAANIHLPCSGVQDFYPKGESQTRSPALFHLLVTVSLAPAPVDSFQTIGLLL